jgi:hypothetical protein
MQESTRLVWEFVHLMVAAIVLTFAIALTLLISQVSRSEAQEAASRELIREYREFNVYNNLGLPGDSVVFHTADVIGAIMMYRGQVEVAINMPGGHTPAHASHAVWASARRMGPDRDTPTRGINQVAQEVSTPANYNLDNLTTWFDSQGFTARRWSSRLLYDEGGTVVRIIFILRN